MSNQVYISQDANEVNLVNTDKQIVITEIGNGTSVNVTQPLVNIIEVSTPGPKGDVGATGPTGPTGPMPETGSFATTGSNTFVGNQVITGSLNITAGITGSLLGTVTTASYAIHVSGGSAGYIPLWKSDNTLGTSSFHQDDGNVGLGILLPEAKLHVKGPGSTDLYTSLLIQNSNGNPSFVVLGSGHVGIENLAPSYELDVTGTGRFTSGLIVTGSTQGNISALTVSSNTASMDLSSGSFYTLQLISGSNVYINPSNIKPGLTATILVSTTGSGTVSFPSSVKQPSGSAYIPTTSTGKDVLTLLSYDTSTLYVASVKNLI